LRSTGLEHGNPLAVHGPHQDPAGLRLWDTFQVEGVKVLGRLREQFFQAALGNQHAGDLGDGMDGFLEGALHSRLDQTLLQWAGKRTRRQLERLIQRVDAVGAVARVAQAGDPDRSKDGLEGAGAEAPVSIQPWLGGWVNAQSGSHLSVAPLLNAGLEEQSLELPPLVLLLALDLVQGELQGVGGRPPLLPVCELLWSLPGGVGDGDGGRRKQCRRSRRSRWGGA
jgi:hypothetical protein